ncbi:PD-(D/E)XK nuclease family protein [Candidatus Woesearchaeota archaeon]|nr:PD-(D/E)XK nuclease family protein [Candidatus Woesearchaeota archaeon]
MGKRVQSPSSINTYKQCPRKYYYSYIAKLPTKDSIHLIRGSITHKVLEDFFKPNLGIFSQEPNWKDMLLKRALSLFEQYWLQHRFQLASLNLNKEELSFYFEETKLMIVNWISFLNKKIEKEISKGSNFFEAFQKLTPLTEKEYNSEEHQVRGFIDAIEELDGKIRLMDYKTSKKFEITDEYKLQLAIYALLYFEKHKKLPDHVGIYFLKGEERLLNVDENLLKLAKFEIEQIHAATETDQIGDYPKKESPLCRWSTGECDFYSTCKK